MHKLFWCHLLLIFGLLGCNPKPNPGMSAEIAIIKSISATRAKAFNEGNANGIAIYFTDDAFLMAPGRPTKRGRVAIEAYYQAIFDEFHTELESGYEDVRVDGTLAYGRGYAKVKLTSKKDGVITHSTAKYLNILEKQADGSWLTTHDIWNGNE